LISPLKPLAIGPLGTREAHQHRKYPIPQAPSSKTPGMALMEIKPGTTKMA